MSRWLGMRRSGERSPTSAEAAAAAANDVKGAFKRTSSPRAGRRRSSEETVDGEASRRSSQQSQADGGVGGGNNDGVAIGGGGGGAVAAAAAAAAGCDGKMNKNSSSDRDLGGSGSCAFESDWEVLEDMRELEGFHADGSSVGEHEHPDAGERPLSPGVDFSTAYMVDMGGGTGRQEGDGDGASSSERDGNKDGCKWEDAASLHSFLVRGPTYLQDKAKLPAGTAMCRLVGFDCFSEESEGTTRVDHIASRGTCRERVEAMTSGDDAPFLFIMNIQVRGAPPVSMVAYWAIDRQGLQDATVGADGDEDCDGIDTDATLGYGQATGTTGDDKGSGGQATGRLANLATGGGGEEEEAPRQGKTFLGIVARYANLPVSSFGGDKCGMMDEAPPPPSSDERNARFKLIPRVIGGPWVVRKAIGSTPVLLGTKVTHRYYRGERYIETDIDTGSSAAAASLCGRCRGLSRKITVELGIVLQANSTQELPEALLGAVRLNGFGVEDPALQTKLFPDRSN